VRLFAVLWSYRQGVAVANGGPNNLRQQLTHGCRHWGLVHPLPCVDSTIPVTDSRNHGLHGVTRMKRSPLLMFGFGMCCAVFAASMVGGSLWLATTFIAR
jgi:hypothetical protein